jgi:NitT/TauT family transport system substrate-binding protein
MSSFDDEVGREATLQPSMDGDARPARADAPAAPPAGLWLPGAARVSRRRFLHGAALGISGAGAALLAGCGTGDKSVGAGGTGDAPGVEPPPEVTRIRLPKPGGAGCAGPLWMARDFLLDEGFTEVEYVTVEGRYSEINDGLTAGKFDLAFNFAPALAFDIARGLPLVVLAGAHVACFELFATDAVASIGDLRGKRVTVADPIPTETDFSFLTAILQFIGIVPGRDVELVAWPRGKSVFVELQTGRIDAVLANPPMSQSLHASNQAHVILSSMVDRPWSQYLCCLIATNREFLEKHPVAAKRALRAILKGVDVCAREPERSALSLSENGWASTDSLALEVMKMLPYDAWRSYSPEDALRFYSLRLKEAGAVGSTPDEIIAKGTDWRFLKELRQELAFLPGRSTPSAFRLDCDNRPAAS